MVEKVENLHILISLQGFLVFLLFIALKNYPSYIQNGQNELNHSDVFSLLKLEGKKNSQHFHHVNVYKQVSHKVDELCEEVHEAHEAAEVLGFVDPPGSKARIRNLIEII